MSGSLNCIYEGEVLAFLAFLKVIILYFWLLNLISYQMFHQVSEITLQYTQAILARNARAAAKGRHPSVGNTTKYIYNVQLNLETWPDGHTGGEHVFK